ncbi:hypothetical protein ACXDGV_000846 [Campylobacter upsaliensis]
MWGGGRSSKVKQGGSRVKREFIKRVAAGQGQARRGQTRLKRHGKFTPSGKANSRQKAKPNLAKPKKLFLKAKSQKIGAKRYIGAKLNLVS